MEIIISITEFRPAEIKRSSNKIRVTSPSRSIKATIGDTIFAIPGITIEIQCPHTGLPQPRVRDLLHLRYPKNLIRKSILCSRKTPDLSQISIRRNLIFVDLDKDCIKKLSQDISININDPGCPNIDPEQHFIDPGKIGLLDDTWNRKNSII